MPCKVCDNFFNIKPCENKDTVIFNKQLFRKQKTYETVVKVKLDRYIIATYNELHNDCPCKTCLVKTLCSGNNIREDDICDDYKVVISRNDPILVRLDNETEKRVAENKKGRKITPDRFIKLPGLMNNYIRMLERLDGYR